MRVEITNSEVRDDLDADLLGGLALNALEQGFAGVDESGDAGKHSGWISRLPDQQNLGKKI